MCLHLHQVDFGSHHRDGQPEATLYLDEPSEQPTALGAEYCNRYWIFEVTPKNSGFFGDHPVSLCCSSPAAATSTASSTSSSPVRTCLNPSKCFFFPFLHKVSLSSPLNQHDHDLLSILSPLSLPCSVFMFEISPFTRSVNHFPIFFFLLFLFGFHSSI